MNVSQYLHNSFSEEELCDKYGYLVSQRLSNPCSPEKLKEALNKKQLGRVISKHDPKAYKRIQNYLKNVNK